MIFVQKFRDTPQINIVHIFDRYGKPLKQLTVSSNGWNGTFNGSALPADIIIGFI
jgi:gliding motility-associated-like protein